MPGFHMAVRTNNYMTARDNEGDAFMLYDADKLSFVNAFVAEIANLIILESVKRGSRGIVLHPILADPSKKEECKELVYYVAERILREVFYQGGRDDSLVLVTKVRGYYIVFPEIRTKEGLQKFIGWIEEWYGDLTNLIRALASHFVNVKLANAGSVRIEPKSLRRRFGYTPQEIDTLRKTLRR